MNKILLNILIFIGSQQFILGTEVNKKIEPKKGVCLSCYTDWCKHNIDDQKYKNCLYCVKKVYSVCSEGHTMCAECILDYVKNGVKYNRGVIQCICFIQEQPIGGKNFKPCKKLIDKNVVIQILKKLETNEKKLLEKYMEMQNEILLLEPQNKRCKYEGCKGYFDVTQGFICNENKSHAHCGNCFEKIHKEKCKDPLEEYKKYIQLNEEIKKKIENRELKEGDTEGYKPCPNCHLIIAKCDGCNHMTCGKDYGGNCYDWQGKGCGYQWCWRCGKACFCEDAGEPGYQHYDYNNTSCNGKHFVGRNPDFHQDYFDDGDYFGIKNGKFKEQFKKLAEDMLINVEVETPNKYPEIKKKNWNSVIEVRKKWREKSQEEHYADYSKNCCTECCCYVFTFFQ